LETFHGVIPKSIAARWIVQNAPSDPQCIHQANLAGPADFNWRNERWEARPSTRIPGRFLTPKVKLSNARQSCAAGLRSSVLRRETVNQSEQRKHTMDAGWWG
jgi:hypothetical protein